MLKLADKYLDLLRFDDEGLVVVTASDACFSMFIQCRQLYYCLIYLLYYRIKTILEEEGRSASPGVNAQNGALKIHHDIDSTVVLDSAAPARPSMHQGT